MKTMVVLLALIGCGSFTALASEKSDLLENWYLENQRCRGGHGNDPATDKACERRTVISGSLRNQGCRYYAPSGPEARWVCSGYTPECSFSEARDRVICK